MGQVCVEAGQGRGCKSILGGGQHTSDCFTLTSEMQMLCSLVLMVASSCTCTTVSVTSHHDFTCPEYPRQSASSDL